MAIPLRGLRTIRTMAGKVDPITVPHRAHLQVACLELEKTRRATERTSAVRRVAELDARLREIDSEQARLLQALAAHKEKNAGAGAKPPSRVRAQPFRIRY
ncbi:MAG: hypothetical protein LAN64_17500 [Acidobacteriia bacterium]|nr:hypothetical protein [Terriglobia bacterium]